MAELILTDEEQQLDTYLDLSDDALGKLTRATAIDLSDANGWRSIGMTAAGRILIVLAHEMNAARIAFSMEGVTIKGEDLGNWTVEIKKVEEGI
jgi:hypothetical protein